MTDIPLRDYFAAHAPDFVIDDGKEAELMGRPTPSETASVLEHLAWAMAMEAKFRYAYADAMLKERRLDAAPSASSKEK